MKPPDGFVVDALKPTGESEVQLVYVFGFESAHDKLRALELNTGCSIVRVSPIVPSIGVERR